LRVSASSALPPVFGTTAGPHFNAGGDDVVRTGSAVRCAVWPEW
jgi:hypothetical protein